MSKNIYCPFCGSIQEEGQQFCTNCGAGFEEKTPNDSTGVRIIRQSSTSSPTFTSYGSQTQSAYQQPYSYGSTTSNYSTYQTPTRMYRSSTNYANTAMILAIVGFFVGCFILPMIGFSYLNKAKRNNEDKNTIRIAEILLWIQLILYIIGILVITFQFSAFFFWY